jgi:rod shape determining protein RodA
MFALCGIGIVAIDAATHFRSDAIADGYWEKQLAFIGIGTVVFLVMSLVDFRWLKFASIPVYLGSIALVALTHTGIGVEISGARCWLRLPVVGVFQPSQLAVLSGILVLSAVLTWTRNTHPIVKVLLTGIITGIPIVLILKQPDMGMTMVWIPVIYAIWWIAGLPKRYILMVTLIGATVLAPVICFALKEYQRRRISSFMDPEIDPRGSGWMINQSLIAIGSGGFGGKGLRAPDTQTSLGMISEDVAHTDYIFTVIGEQGGFVASAIVVGAFGALLLAIVVTVLRSGDLFGRLVAIGFGGQIFFHTYQNIGMTVALMPITGLPLPLISYGGTFVLTIMFSLGVVNSVWIHHRATATDADADEHFQLTDGGGGGYLGYGTAEGHRAFLAK